MEALGWHTVGRLAILLGTPVARTVLRLFARPLLDRKRAAFADLEAFSGSGRDLLGGDLTRLSPDLIAVWT
jgi:hypothetical protein